ncbi:unnamed protein product [Nyctereutes procyonoides]|uniref:WASH complex subunit 3 n=1 Tax=Nyctereutes procyonoides TaxID=34880 RepID=A0A811YX45_NYCPR|nr:unnamed protein product [Nyctereutes procyonoides]
MDEDGLPLMGSGFCEEKLADLSPRVQHIETTLNILDVKLSSIPGLNDVTFEVSPVSVTGVTNESHSETTSEKSQQNSLQDSGPQRSEVTPENILTVAKDPKYARYLKMVQVGVPVMALRNKMISEGLDPDLLERPDAPVPDGECEKNTEESSDSESSLVTKLNFYNSYIYMCRYTYTFYKKENLNLNS